MFIEHSAVSAELPKLGWVLAAGAVKAFTLWTQELVAQSSSARVKLQLREKFLGAIRKLGAGWLRGQNTPDLNLLANRGLDSLDAYFARYLPQLISTALVTPVMLLAIWQADAASGITLLITLPLVPLFMMMIGWFTRSVQEKQLDSMNRLNRHFLEVLKGLTTLRVFGRADAQVETVAQVSTQFRQRTMRVLRVSFLSGFALELAASLSVALIAVSIGLRLVDGTLGLAVGLFVLILAPEGYLPLRLVGANFHASSEGVAASSGILDVIDSSRVTTADPDSSLQLNPGEVVLLVGESGAGKTTALRQLAASLPANELAVLPQNVQLWAASIQENIVGASVLDESALGKAVELAALLDYDLNLAVGDRGEAISGGERLRVALARVFYRTLTQPVKFLLLDEPIAALDSTTATRVLESIAHFANSGVAVLVVSHQLQARDIATRIEAVHR